MTAMRQPALLAERWFRTRPDSSGLDRPRLLARSLIDVSRLDEQIAFYERLLGVPADLRMPIPDFGGLELAAVGHLLLIASERPFTPIQRRTSYTLIVPSLSRQLELLAELGGSVLEPVEQIVPGSRARVRYPDGAIAEFVEHRPQPGELPDPPAPLPAAGSGVPGGGTVRLFARRAVPRAAFPAAVAHYERALETTGRGFAAPGGTGAVRLSIVGNLLLVGTDEPDDDDAPVRFALLSEPWEEAAARVVALLPDGSAPVAAPAPGGDGYHGVLPLVDGVLAEVWDAQALG